MIQAGILRTVIAVAAGALFIGYCIHFDRKRRSDPDFKTRLRERRRKQAAEEAAELSNIPDLSDPMDVQTFYLKELQQGEELMAHGAYEKGVDHMANAVVVFPQQSVLLKMMEQSLPAPVFQHLLNKLQAVSAHIAGAQSRKQEVVAALRERRRKQAAKEAAKSSNIPDLPDAMAVQNVYMEELQQFKELMAQGDYEKAVDHMANAVATCPQQQVLLKVLEQVLTPLIFQRVLNKLPAVSQHIAGARSRMQEVRRECRAIEIS